MLIYVVKRRRLLDSIEGKRGQPRTKPPFPVNEGAWGLPTIVNNVETLTNIPHIMKVGGKAYSEIGNPESPGPKLFSVSGCVRKPGLYELDMGVTLREIIYDHAGGISNDRDLKAVIPGASRLLYFRLTRSTVQWTIFPYQRQAACWVRRLLSSWMILCAWLRWPSV